MSEITKTNNNSKNWIIGIFIISILLIPKLADSEPTKVKAESGQIDSSAVSETKEEIEKQKQKLELKKQMLDLQEKLKNIDSSQSSSEEKKAVAK
jgi:hypothetical protein